jgi:hypothetical protein
LYGGDQRLLRVSATTPKEALAHMEAVLSIMEDEFNSLMALARSRAIFGVSIQEIREMTEVVTERLEAIRLQQNVRPQ